ncbi:hypothetical protein DL96DRAFT_1822523 [Flagelloscypha sp. PMI_526]|nr:hypothetical protein DL96DRAFT_1822523 [Flagelloscypha sp. PMI_526]
MDQPTSLPLEIVEHVLDYVHLKKDLGACCLINRGLLPRSRAKLFAVITVVSREDIQSLYSHLLRAPHLNQFISHLGILDIESYFHSFQEGYPTTNYLADLLLLLKGSIRTVTFFQERYYGFEWQHVPEHLRDALAAVANDPACEGLDLQIYGECAPAVRLLPNIRHLDLYSVRDLLSSLPSDIVPLRLTSFRASFVLTESSWTSNRNAQEDYSKLRHLIDLSQLERLVVDPNLSYRLSSSSGGTHRDFASGPWMSLFATAAATSLVDLFWETGSLDLTRPDIRLSELPNLRNLNIGLTAGCNFPDCQQRCDMILNFLSTRTPLLPIANSSFSFEVGDLYEDALLQFIRVLTDISNCKIGFLHQGAQYMYDERAQDAYALLKAASHSRTDCNIEVLIPTESFGSWVELRRERPYGHIVPATSRMER